MNGRLNYQVYLRLDKLVLMSKKRGRLFLSQQSISRSKFHLTLSTHLKHPIYTLFMISFPARYQNLLHNNSLWSIEQRALAKLWRQRSSEIVVELILLRFDFFLTHWIIVVRAHLKQLFAPFYQIEIDCGKQVDFRLDFLLGTYSLVAEAQKSDFV